MCLDTLLCITSSVLFRVFGNSMCKKKKNTLHEHLYVIEYFASDIVVLMIGTNDIYSKFNTLSDVASDIVTLLGKLVTKHRVQYVKDCHRAPAVFTRYAVDLEWFNSRVDA